MLKQLTLEDAAEASMMFSVLMGDKVLSLPASVQVNIIF
jgi:DNA gyrase/topoisomerase IV subunit B